MLFAPPLAALTTSVRLLPCRYRYTMEELRKMADMLELRAVSYRDWSNRVEQVLDGVVPEKAGQ